MEALGTVLPIVIYILLIGLLVICIILGIKLIMTIDKINDIVEGVNQKIESLNGIFKVVNLASEKMNLIGSKIADGIMAMINKLFGLKNGKDGDDYE